MSDVKNSRVADRVSTITESVTLAVDAKAKALRAEGHPVIIFGAGEPDFPTPAPIVEAAVQACRDPKNHRYTPAGGQPALKKAIVEKTRRDSGYEIKPENVLVTNGGKQAIYEGFAAILNPGDEVIIPAPYWTTYPESVKLAGGVPVPVLTTEETDFQVTIEQLDAALTDKTKCVLFVSPNNPTGAVCSQAETEAIGRWIVEHDLWVMTDEIYEHLTYDGIEQVSLPVVVPALRDKCLVVNGVAKTYAMTGWRVGWLIGPADIVKAATNYQSHATSNVNNVAQVAAIAALNGDLAAVHEMKVAFTRRRSIIVDMLNEIDGVHCPTPQGAFYVYPSVQGVIGKTILGHTVTSSLDLADFLLEKSLVAVVPGEAFGTPGYLRLSYALSDDQLKEGITRMRNLINKGQAFSEA